MSTVCDHLCCIAWPLPNGLSYDFRMRGWWRDIFGKSISESNYTWIEFILDLNKFANISKMKRIGVMSSSSSSWWIHFLYVTLWYDKEKSRHVLKYIHVLKYETRVADLKTKPRSIIWYAFNEGPEWTHWRWQEMSRKAKDDTGEMRTTSPFWTEKWYISSSSFQYKWVD